MPLLLKLQLYGLGLFVEGGGGVGVKMHINMGLLYVNLGTEDMFQLRACSDISHNHILNVHRARGTEFTEPHAQ